jgi:hypothetical protein
VYLPRTFKGPIRVTTSNGRVTYSASINAKLTRVYDVDGVQNSFIGHFEPAQWLQEPGANWEGDELRLKSLANGSVYINYMDDLDFKLSPTVIQTVLVVFSLFSLISLFILFGSLIDSKCPC